MSLLSHSTSSRRIGLIAGWGHYPVLLAEALRRKGYEVVCLAIQQHADPRLREQSDAFHSCRLTRMSDQIGFLKRHGVQRATLAGKIHKVRFFQRRFLRDHWPDLYCIRCFFPHFITGKRDRKDDTLLLAAVEGYQRRGIEIVPATDLIPELLIPRGLHCGARLSGRERRDIAFGWQLAKAMGGLDVGQSVAVKGQAVLAVEAVEGTDACIERAGQLCPSGGFVVVKVAKPDQDMRFDVPTVGLGTMKAMQAAGGRVLAVEAGRTILVDEAESLDFAQTHGIVVTTLGEVNPCDHVTASPTARSLATGRLAS